jgi:hypothetical protein
MHEEKVLPSDNSDRLLHALSDSSAGIGVLSRELADYLRLSGARGMPTCAEECLHAQSHRITYLVSRLLRSAARAIEAPELDFSRRIKLIQLSAELQIDASRLLDLMRALAEAASPTYSGD